jgi:signal transduction histidine kinase/CheY-like chemotaxis protein
VRAEAVVAVARLDEHRVVHAAAALPGVPIPAAPNAGIVAMVGRTNRPHWAGRDRVLGVPMIGRDGRNLGVLQVAGPPGPTFEPEDEDLLVQLAQMASVAVENTLAGEAREANRLKDEFLATVSHELRTPLSAILSWAAILRRAGGDAAVAPRAVEAIERNARAQARLVDDLLDVSRIVTGKLQLERRPLDLVSVVRSAVEAVVADAEHRGLVLETVLPATPVVVDGDPDRLRQVAVNLLSNAVKFTDHGGRVRVTLDGDGPQARLAVADTGIGIAAEHVPLVFERFRQVEPAQARGLGLGLAIVRHLVELHGGAVEAQSPGIGLGATFTVRLPLASHAGLVDGARSPWPAGAALPRLAGVRVLLVEDETDIRDALLLTLLAAGARPRAVASAEEALAAMAEAVPDVIVCDIGLPAVDGYALIRRLRTLPRERGGGVPAIALTAYARPQDRRAALEAGFQAHVAKPVDPERLLELLVEQLRTTAEPGSVAAS